MASERRLRVRRGAAALTLPLLASCTLPTGLVFTDVTVPLDRNLSGQRLDERAGHGGGAGDVRHFRYYIQVDWGENGIGGIQKDLGWERIEYADVRRVRALWYWRQEIVELYGR